MALSKNNPTIQKSWKSLEKIYEQENDLKIVDYLKNEPNRVERFSISLNNIYLDFSKNRISEKALNYLIDLCNETDLKKNINKYFDGEEINETEKRAVLHTALRSNKATKINEEVQNNLKKIEIISNEINNGKRLGYSGKKIENIVNIGIGGSHLGPEMVTEALSQYNHGIKPYFISNIDVLNSDGSNKEVHTEEQLRDHGRDRKSKISLNYCFNNFFRRGITDEEIKEEDKGIVFDYKQKFRRQQIETEGNDPAKSGEAQGTPSDMAMGRTGHELDDKGGAPEGGFEGAGRPKETPIQNKKIFIKNIKR